jgi:transcriptional regulator with XRE-family HTH domain
MEETEAARNEWRRNIVARVAQARVAQGITQAQLAEMLGTHRSNISRLESGSHNPSLDFLLRVVTALDMELTVRPFDRASKEERSEEEENIYELRLYDTVLLTFALEEKGIDGLTAEILTIDEKQENLLPLDMTLTNEGILQWLERRVIPKNRAFVEDILRALKLSLGNTRGIIDVCRGLSLNDSYWIVPRGFKGTFAKYNLYENRFSEILALVAYTGVGKSVGAFSTSPELTTAGMLPKAWRQMKDGGIYLYKGGSSGAANTGNEPYSEYYACQIAQMMGLRAVSYGLEKWKGMLASTCRLFTDIATAYVPIGRIVTSGGLRACLDYHAELGEDFLEAVRSMLVFDAVIYNEDRHFGNFGILRDNHSGAIIAPAPLFDHGLSLFSFAMRNDIANIDEYAKTRSPVYGTVTFESICAEVMGRTQAQQLRRLIGFHFTRHPSINWSEERLDAIERHLQKRVRQLLGLSR